MDFGNIVVPFQNLGINFEPLYENRMTYNSPQNRLNLRDPRYLVVELKLFIIVILNALKRCPDRHELWLHFLVDALPYLDRFGVFSSQSSKLFTLQNPADIRGSRG